MKNWLQLIKTGRSFPEEVQEQVNINIKYDGYIKRQIKQVEHFKKLENKKIPDDFDYDAVESLRIEARQKLKLYRPVSIGQASRISRCITCRYYDVVSLYGTGKKIGRRMRIFLWHMILQK